jgi:hypothetical protein
MPGQRRPTPAEKKAYDLDNTQYMWTEEQLKEFQEELNKKASEAAAALRATQAYKDWEKALDDEQKVNNDPNATAEDKKAAQKAAEDAYNKMINSPEGQEHLWRQKRAQEGPLPYSGKKVSRTDPNAVSACEELSEFVARCNDNGWKRQDCQSFLQRMKGCADPAVTDPLPDNDETCRLPAADPEAARRAAVLACQKVTRPVPGVDPCSPMAVDAQVYTFALGRGKPCSDPAAITDPEQCVPTMSLATFGRTLTQRDLDALRKKAGGPVIFLPRLGPAPSPPNPGGPTPDPPKPPR